MPTFTGISEIGIEEPLPVRPAPGQWVSLEIKQTTLDSANSRFGLMIIAFENSLGSLRVIETFKIFGGGLFVLPRWPTDGTNARIAIDWYNDGLEWELNVPFDPLP